MVLTQDAQTFAQQMGIQLFETSAKENINVEEVGVIHALSSLYLLVCLCICICVSVCIYIYICVEMYMCMNMIVQVCPYVHILRLYVLYDYVQRCEETISIEFRCINWIYCTSKASSSSSSFSAFPAISQGFTILDEFLLM